MKRTIRLLLMLVLFSGTFLTAFAQNGATLKGSTVDSLSAKPIPYITVRLIAEGGQIVHAMATTETGEFKFGNLKAGKYKINFSSLEFSGKIMDVIISAKDMDLGQVKLQVAAKNIKMVSITGNKPLISRDIDKLTYDVQADPESKSSDALNMMKKIPYLTVDGNDQLLMKGKEDYKILINGKPSSMMERDAKTMLKNMPASNISKIEVITNPSAKYDGEGIGGVINIVTSKSIADGYNGSVQTSHRFPVGGPGFGGTVNIKDKKFGISASGNINTGHTPMTSRSKTLLGLTTSNNLIQLGSERGNSESGYFNSELSYEIDTLTLISGSVAFNKNGNRSSSSQLSELRGSGSLLEGYELVNNIRNRGNGNDASFNFQRGFKKNKNQLLTASYRTYGSKSNLNSLQLISSRVNYIDPNFNQRNLSSSREHTGQLDYYLPLKKITFETGIKAINRANVGDFEYDVYDAIIGTYAVDLTRSNEYVNDQWIYGAYSSLSLKMKGWSIRTGLRLEQTNIDAQFISTGTIVNQTFSNLLPSISFNFPLNDQNSLNVNYNQRVRRPGISRLNPFVDRSNPNFESAGNPNLKASLMNVVEVEYGYYGKLSATVGVNYNFADGMFLPIATFNPATQVTRTTVDNVGKANGVSMNYYLNYPITKKWSATVNGSVEYITLLAPTNNVMTRTNVVMTRNFVSSSYTIQKGWRVNANANYNGRGVTTLQGRTVAYIGSNFSTSRDFLKSKLTASVNVSNPFQKYRNNLTETTALDFLQLNTNQEYFRSFGVSMYYKFGKLKENIRKGKRSIRNDDN